MRFTIGFDKEDTKKLHAMWDEIINTNKWAEGKFTQEFEDKWGAIHDTYAIAFASWAGAALSVLEYYKLRGKRVLCPSNTFMATPLVNYHLGCEVEFVDCNKEDLCLSLSDLKKKVKAYKPDAVWVVHIGGHIAFEIEKIAEFCRRENIILIEDCAHAHGASWNGRKPGSWSDAGVYSFYATKTVSTGEGGMLVTKNKDLMEFAKKYRNYGKFDFKVQGVNFRMSEFTAAIGSVQADRMDEIVKWKNDYAKKNLDDKYKKRVNFPEGMVSGYYKYIVFEPVEKSSGKVYDEPCHKILAKDYSLPNTEWVAGNHWCIPIYYKGEE